MLGAARIGLVASAGRTYADFQTHIATLATNGSTPPNQGDVPIGAYRITLTPSSSYMAGSSWGAEFSKNESSPDMVIQHGLPSKAVSDAQRSVGREVFIRTIVSPSGDGDTFSVLRNGYTSVDSALGGPRARLTELIYWDGAQAQRMQPFISAGPTPYTF